MLIPVVSNYKGHVAGTPTKSLSFVAASSQSLSMTDANFGAFDRAKWAISAWFKRSSTGGDLQFFRQGDDGGSNSASMHFGINTSGNLALITYVDGVIINGNLTTNTGSLNNTNWNHVLFHYDSANATPGDRMRLWVNGTESTFGTDTNPTAAVFNSSQPVEIGGSVTFGGTGYNGLLYQFIVVSGSLPLIGTVYNAGHPMDISALTGLYSYLDCAAGSVISDGVLATDWTNNNTVTASSTIPT